MGVVVQKPVIPACGGGWRQEDQAFQTRLRYIVRPCLKIRKKEYTLTEDLITIFLGAQDRGLRAATDRHESTPPQSTGLLFIQQHSTFAHFHLCAAFRSQLMFALGGAQSPFAGQSGNSEGRDRGQQKGNAVFSWRPAVTL